jgi:hypothetical protein
MSEIFFLERCVFFLGLNCYYGQAAQPPPQKKTHARTNKGLSLAGPDQALAKARGLYCRSTRPTSPPYPAPQQCPATAVEPPTAASPTGV